MPPVKIIKYFIQTETGYTYVYNVVEGSLKEYNGRLTFLYVGKTTETFNEATILRAFSYIKVGEEQ